MTRPAWRTVLRWRTFVLLLALLGLGAMVNVGLAWYFAYHPKAYPLHTPTCRSAETGPLWIYQERSYGVATRRDGTAATRWAGGGGHAIEVHTPPAWSIFANPPAPADNERIEEAFGMPLPSMAFELIAQPRGGLKTCVAEPAIILNKPHPHDQSRSLALPLRPLWANFLANTLFWAVAVSPLVALLLMGGRFLFATRRRWRLRQGRCVRCGYQLQGDHAAGCSECGWNRRVSPANDQTPVSRLK